MNSIALNIQMMTSREIAEYTGKRHDHVMRDVENMAKELGIDPLNSEEISPNLGSAIKSTTYRVEGQAREYPMYELNKEMTLTLTSGYSVKQRNAIIKRWMELEAKEQQVKPLPQGSARWIDANATMRSAMDLAEMTGIPKHFVIIETGKEIYNSIGLDLRPMLAHSKYMDDIKDDEKMLEPTELGAMHGISANKMNKLLEVFGLQVKAGKIWTPTDKGSKYCSAHAWTKNGKSGYNLKWNAEAVNKMMRETLN